LPGRTERDLPAIGLDGIHSEGGDEDDTQRHRPEPGRGVIDIPGTDVPDDETEREATDKE